MEAIETNWCNGSRNFSVGTAGNASKVKQVFIDIRTTVFLYRFAREAHGIFLLYFTKNGKKTNGFRSNYGLLNWFKFMIYREKGNGLPEWVIQ